MFFSRTLRQSRASATTLIAARRAVQKQKPLVQCITNYVSMDIMANVLCASDMSPAMAHGGKCGEAAEFAKLVATVGGAVNINLGTLDEDWALGAREAVKVCNDAKVPWVVDPVGVGFLSYRTGVLKDLLSQKPTVLRANPSECITCARFFPELKDMPATESEKSAQAKGVDSVVGSSDVNLEMIDALALHMGGVVCMTGAHDYVTDGKQKFSIQHEVPELQDVIASGCALGSVVAGFNAVEKENPAVATAHAVAYFTLAAEKARDGAGGAGPGSLRVGLMDCLKNLNETDMQKARIVDKSLA